MKNGVEIRKNGNIIVRRPDYEYYEYEVKIKQPDGSFRTSTRSPWAYLRNARKDADGGLDQ